VMVDGREIEEAWRVGCSVLIPEKSKESNQAIFFYKQMLATTIVTALACKFLGGVSPTKRSEDK
ncbi:hypothetical protein L9F63_004059, partial [Diploptera punctata]